MKIPMRAILLFFLSLSLLAGVSSSGEARPRVVATDLFAAEVQVYLENNLGGEVDFSWVGTLRADEKWQSGQAEALLVVRPGGVLPSDDQVQRYPIGFIVPHLVVPEGTPLRELSMTQVAAIFGGREDRSIQQWRDLEVGGSLANQGIIPVIQSNQHHLASEIVRHGVLSSPHFRTNARIAETHQQAVQLLLLEGASLGLIGRPPRERTLRVVPIRQSGEQVAFLPTPENVFEGDYPLGIPVMLEFRRDDQTKLQPLAEVLFSEPMAAVLAEGGMVPVPLSAQLRYLGEFNR